MTISFLDQQKDLNALVLFIDENKKILGRVQNKIILNHLEKPLALDFKGKFRESLMIYPSVAGATAKRILLIGAGSAQTLNAHQMKTLAAHACNLLRAASVSKNAALLVPPLKKLSVAQTVEALAQGNFLTQLNFDEFKTEKKEGDQASRDPLEFHFLIQDRKDLKAAEAAQSRGKTIAVDVNWARRLIMIPGGDLYPDQLVKEVQKMVASSPSKSKIKAEYWGDKELTKNKFGGVLGVGQGSDHPPRFIILEYFAGKKSDKPVVLVGKGVTFDSGGLSLKPPSSMETMKYDMAGSASALGAFKIATDLKWAVNLVVLVPTVENMPSGKAIRPGDILRMASGNTVEVLNTDAEGRLILADALFWATTKYQPKAVLDMATLTGACAMAVGEAASGVYTNSEKLLAALQKSASASQENIWPLPNFEDFYASMIKSDVADIKNIGGREAGASTASLFLKVFVKNNIPWAHLDIAGCGWYDGPRDFISSKGASGVPIRLLADFVEKSPGLKL